VSLLAVDMGSSSSKAVAFADDGTALAHATQSYSSHSPQQSWSEMPPETFWRALVTVTQSVAAQVTRDPVEALAISSHGETFFPVDAANRVIGAAILNADNRAVTESKSLTEKVGRRRIFEITGLAPHPMYPLPKIVWLRNHLPNVFSAAKCFLSLPGFLLTRLGLPPFVDYSLASRYLAFDVRKREWSTEILSSCDLSTDQLPRAVPAGTIAGEISTTTAKELSLQPGTPVVLGGHDQPCAALGSGVLEAGRVSASLGTYECLLAASNAPALTKAAFAANLNSYCHVVPDRYVTLAYFPSGIMVDWFARLVHGSEESAGFLARLEPQCSTTPSGLCITPHLLGTSNPDFDTAASGVIAGIRPSTTQADLYKGILEGIACEFSMMAELLQQATGPFDDVYVSGGGGRSQLGLRLRASIAQKSLHLTQCQEAACLGTAILAGVAIGKYKDYSQAVEQVVRTSQTISPDPLLSKQYESQEKKYHLLYSSLAPFRSEQRKAEGES